MTSACNSYKTQNHPKPSTTTYNHPRPSTTFQKQSQSPKTSQKTYNDPKTSQNYSQPPKTINRKPTTLHRSWTQLKGTINPLLRNLRNLFRQQGEQIEGPYIVKKLNLKVTWLYILQNLPCWHISKWTLKLVSIAFHFSPNDSN